MRKYLLSATILTLMTAPSAWADPPAGHGNRGHEGEQGRQGPPQGEQHRGPAPQAAMQAAPNRGNQERQFDRGNRGPQMAIQAAPNRGDRDFDRGNRGAAPAIQAAPNRGDRDRSDNDRRAGFERRDQDNRRTFDDNRGNRPAIDRQASRDFNRDFNRDGRTDFRPNRAGPRRDFSNFRDYHRNFRVSRRFYAQTYRRPAGWYSHRWAFGEFLPTAFWARDYWLVDFAIYDLPPPPYGAVWVRVDRDALLIDEESGEIITVAYDVFY